MRDKDAELKGLSKMHADERRGTRYTNVDVGDEVLVRQDRVNTFATTFNPTPCEVVRKSGNSLIVESPDGVQYSRNASHVRKYVSESRDGDVDTAAGTNNVLVYGLFHDLLYCLVCRQAYGCCMIW